MLVRKPPVRKAAITILALVGIGVGGLFAGLLGGRILHNRSHSDHGLFQGHLLRGKLLPRFQDRRHRHAAPAAKVPAQAPKK